jgi:hypothetical protein
MKLKDVVFTEIRSITGHLLSIADPTHVEFLIRICQFMV